MSLEAVYKEQLNLLNLFLLQNKSTITEDEKLAAQMNIDELEVLLDEIRAIERYQSSLHEMDKQSFNDHNIARRLDGKAPLEDPGVEDISQRLDTQLSITSTPYDTATASPATAYVGSTSQSSAHTDIRQNIFSSMKMKAPVETLDEDALYYSLPANAETYSKPLSFLQSDVKESRQTCNSCLEKFEWVLQLECDHKMCSKCVNGLVKTAVGDISLLPLRCCTKDITIGTLRPLVKDSVLFNRFIELTKEKIAKNKMHCPIIICGQFIDLDYMQSLGRIDSTGEFYCPNIACGISICVYCKATHPHKTCQEHSIAAMSNRSVADMKFAAFANEKLKACSRCHAYIELIAGCNHVTCTCGFDFCYACGLKWKTCNCDAWNEENIGIEAVRRAGNEVNNARVLQRHREAIRNEVDCPAGEHNWVQVNARGGNCRNCPFYMPVYHFRCQRCRLSPICYTCRHHRIG